MAEAGPGVDSDGGTTDRHGTAQSLGRHLETHQIYFLSEIHSLPAGKKGEYITFFDLSIWKCKYYGNALILLKCDQVYTLSILIISF